jgi:quercetin dioxygenase-like cupin family protein
MTYRLTILSALFTIALYGTGFAQNGIIVLTPDQVKWGPAKGLPAGWEAAVLAGAPDKKGPYVERVKLPPNAAVPPHTHPDTENITVLSGSFGIGEGKVADQSKGRVLPAGSFYLLPANTPHFAWAGADGAVIQIHGIGPTGIKMLQSAARNR